MKVTAYCDGSGSGIVSAMFDYGEGYHRTYWGRSNDSVTFEFQAIMFAIDQMTPDHEYTLWNDNRGVVDYINDAGIKKKSDIALHLADRVRALVLLKGLKVKFVWSPRETNLAGRLLDTGPGLLLKKQENQRALLEGVTWSDRGSSSNRGEARLQNPNRYAHWPPEEEEEAGGECE